MKRSLFWLLDHYPETGETIASMHRAAVGEAAEADRLGYTSLWLSEHHFRSLSTIPNPAILLASIAQRTRRIRLGSATAVLPLHNPIHLAEDYAMVDVLSGGRLNLGVGSGSQPMEYAPFGVDFASRRQLFEDNLQAIRSRWHAAASGDVGPGSLNVAPIQSPAPPVYVATMSEDSAYQIGLSGDSLLTLAPPSPEGRLDDVAIRVRAHARGLEAAGLTGGTAESVVMMFAYVATTEAQVEETAIPALGRLMSALGNGRSNAIDSFEQIRRRRLGIFGTPGEASRQFLHLAEVGIEHVALVSRFGGMSKEEALRNLQLLAPPTPDAAGR